MSMLFGNPMKSVILSWRRGPSDNPAPIDARIILIASMLCCIAIAAWTFGIHVLQGRPNSLIYSLAVGLSISISYGIPIFIITRRSSRLSNFWQNILTDFIVFHLISASLLALTFTAVKITVPFGTSSSLWPGLFIRHAPISVTLFFASFVLAHAVRAKRQVKPQPATPWLGDATLLEAQGNYVRVTTAAGSRMIRMTLAMAEQSLPMENFCRIHRSRIVRRDQIESVDWLEATVRLTTGETVKSSSTGLANLRAIFP